MVAKYILINSKWKFFRVVELKCKICEKRWSTFVDINSNLKESAASVKRVIFDIIPWGKHTPLKPEMSEDNNNQNFTKTVNKMTTGPWSIKFIPSHAINWLLILFLMFWCINT